VLGGETTKDGWDSDQAESAASSKEVGRKKDRGASMACGIPWRLWATADWRDGAIVAAGRWTARVW
jgi:hypothetical protein